MCNKQDNAAMTTSEEKKNDIHWADLSRYRGELMGFAMIIILMFHVGGPHNETFAYCLSRCGNIGVDIFLFLSGMGLWFAWQKRPTLKQFFLRRYIRVYPAWFIIACLYFVPLFLSEKMSLTDTLLNISFYYGFWTIYNELHFWYIPAIMALYTIAPAYMTLISRDRAWTWLPIVAILFCILMRYDSDLWAALRHLEIFFSRIPIFLIGINMGQWVRGKRKDNATAWGLVIILLLLSAWICTMLEGGLRGRFPLFMERMVYIPLSITLSLLMCKMFDILPALIIKALAFVGTISLEFYLIHVEFVLKYIRPYDLGYWLTTILTLVITLPLAWLLHKAIEKAIVKRIKV